MPQLALPLLLAAFLGLSAASSPAQSPAAESSPLPPELSKSEAKALAKDFKKSWKPTDGLSAQTSVVETLAKGRHEVLVRPLHKVILHTKHATVRNRAAELLGLQPAEAARETIFALLADGIAAENPAAASRLIAGLRRIGLTENSKKGLARRARAWETLGDLFRGCDYRPEAIPLQKAIFELAAADKACEAIDLVVDHIDEPVPEDPDSPSNPPAAWWEKRWKAWRAWREDAKKALLTITGQRFATGEEAEVWLKRNRAALERESMKARIESIPEDEPRRRRSRRSGRGR